MKRSIPRQQSLIVPEIQNPFVHKLHLGYLDMLQVALMSVTIVPLRLLLIGLCLLLAWPLAAIAVGFRSEEDKKEPLSGWRSKVLRPVIVLLSRGLFFAGGFHWISVKGQRAQPSEAPILSVAPHSSYMDALPTVFLNLTSVVAKVENGNVPAFGIHSDISSHQNSKHYCNSCFDCPLRSLGRLMTFATGMQNIKIKGTPAGSGEAPIACAAPHSSYLDAIVLFYLAGLPSSLSRAENMKYPIISALLQFTQPVLVKREDPNSRQKTVEEIQRRAKTGGAWPQIIIFPEGTCTNRSCLITFKLGAFHPGVPVQPVCLRYPNKIDTITWTWEGPGALTILWLTLCQFNTNLTIEYLPVYKPSPEEIADPKLYANNVRNVMAKALGVPITDHTYDDCRLMMKARALNLPMEAGLVEFQKLHKKLGISVDQMHEMLEKFNNIDLSGKGHITLDEFARYLQLPVSDAIKGVFNVYDRSGTGNIDFREYVIGLSLVSEPANTDSTINLAFHLFDSSQQGYISQDDLFSILHDAFGMTQIDIGALFADIDEDKDGRITYEEFKTFATKKPEYAPLFLAYQEMKKEGDRNGNATPLEPVSEADESHLKSE